LIVDINPFENDVLEKIQTAETYINEASRRVQKAGSFLIETIIARKKAEEVHLRIIDRFNYCKISFQMALKEMVAYRFGQVCSDSCAMVHAELVPIYW